MRLIYTFILLLILATPVFAQWSYDAWGHRTKTENLWKDKDGDGVPNYYDVRDDDARRTYR